MTSRRLARPFRIPSFQEILLAFLIFLALVPARVAVAADPPTWPEAAERRFERARALAQAGKFDAAAKAYREVAEWPEGGAFRERAQALYLAGLMLEDARAFEDAAETYREVVKRFPESAHAARAREAAARLETGGPHGLVFLREYLAAWDVLYPASELARHGKRDEARPALERSVTLFRALLDGHPDDPRAKDAAAALGDAFMDLGEPIEARAAFERAIALSEREAARPGASELVKRDVGIQEEKLHEAVRAIRRERIDLGAKLLLGALIAFAVACRPWTRWTRARTKLAGVLALLLGAAAGIAALASHFILANEDIHEPALALRTFPLRAGALVLLPGLAGSLVALGVSTGLGRRRGALLGGVLGVLAAVALSATLLRAFELFPFLDQEL